MTPLGALLATLPVDVSSGKLLVYAALFGLAGPSSTIAAALSVKSPFTQKGAGGGGGREDDQRAEFQSPHGDPFTLLKVFASWLRARYDAR